MFTPRQLSTAALPGAMSAVLQGETATDNNTGSERCDGKVGEFILAVS